MAFPRRKRGSSRNREECNSSENNNEKDKNPTISAHSSNSKSSNRSKSKSFKRSTEYQPPQQQIVKSKNISSTPINYNLQFEDLGGLQDQIEEIKNSVIYKVENRKLLQKYGLNYRVGGILLEGPPGTGKTICAHTIAAELSRRTGLPYTFFTHNAVESMTKWLGESESNLRHLFKVAVENAPSIIFFDEFDAICPRRDDKKSNTEHKTIVATLLSEFNKIQDEDVGLVIIGATNIVDNIDPAMLRSGRFDTILNFSLPVSEQRMEIIRLKMKGFLMPQHLISWLTKETPGYSGAHLTYLCHEAQLNCFKRQIDVRGHSRGSKNNFPPELGEFIESDFLPVLEKIKIFGNPQFSHNISSSSSNSNQTEETTYDALTEELCKSLVETVKSFVPKHNELLASLMATNNLCSQVVNSFLLWSYESNNVLTKIVVPRILKLLDLPFFKISESQIQKLNSKKEKSVLYPDDSDDEQIICNTCGNLQLEHQKKRLNDAIENVVTETSKVKGSAVLLIENINEVFSQNYEHELYNLVSSLPKNVLLLATSSCEVSNLPSHLQPLFVRLGNEKSWKLRLPSEREISKCLYQISDKYIIPRINQLPQMLVLKLKLTCEKDNWPHLLKLGLKMAVPTFEDVHLFRSQLLLELLTSSDEDFVKRMESFKFRH